MTQMKLNMDMRKITLILEKLLQNYFMIVDVNIKLFGLIFNLAKLMRLSLKTFVKHMTPLFHL